MIIFCWALGLFMFSGWSGPHVSAQPPGDSMAAPPGAAAASRLVATGRGRQPWRISSKARARLMAKRAAMVEAYKSMAAMLGMSVARPGEGAGSERVEGFIKGARLRETRFYANGDVEVDIEMTAPASGGRMGYRESTEGKDQGKDAGVVFVERGGGTISESEWREILGKVDAPGH